MLIGETAVGTLLCEIDGLLAVNEPRHLVLDLTQVRWAGTPAISLLIRLKARCAQLDCEFGLCGLQPPFREVLQITNLEQLFPIYGDAERAIAELAVKHACAARTAQADAPRRRVANPIRLGDACDEQAPRRGPRHPAGIVPPGSCDVARAGSRSSG